VRIDEQGSFAARIPLADIRSARTAHGYQGRFLPVLIAWFLAGGSRELEEHTLLSWAWFGFFFIFVILSDVPFWTKPRLRLELEHRTLKLPLELPWNAAPAFAASLAAVARRSASPAP
jgi:hypothetical protein